MLRFKRFAFVFILGILALPAIADVSPTERNLLAKLNGDQMKQSVSNLCTREFAGRRAGSEGERLAAQYLIKQFQEIGLQPLPGVQEYSQGFTMRYSLVNSIKEIKARMILPLAGKSTEFAFAYPYYYGQGGIDKKARIVFAGYGITAKDQNHDDYDSLDARGKIVLLLSGVPKGIKGVTNVRKMITAYEHGAIGCLIVGDSAKAEDWSEGNYGLSSPVANFPTIQVDRSLTDKILGESGLKLSRLEAGVRDGTAPSAYSMKNSATLKVPELYDPSRPSQNIIGYIPGSDPILKNEFVVVSGHYDHLGECGGQIFHGADDDASGMATTLGIARALIAMPEKPKRSVLFVAFGGEEGGLLGSNYFAEHPPVPMDRIKAVLQMDMVGVGTRKAFETTGGQGFPETYQFVKDAAKDLGYIITGDVFKGASDNLPMARKKTPAFMFTTAGEHPDYHMASDLPDRIDPMLLEDTAKLVALSAWRLASHD